MKCALMMVSAGRRGAGLTAVALGTLRVLQREGLRVAFCKPIEQAERLGRRERAVALAQLTASVEPPDPLPLQEVERALVAGEEQRLLERIIGLCATAAEGADVLVVEGLLHDEGAAWVPALNLAIARSLDARLVLVGQPEDTPAHTAATVSAAAQAYHTLGDNLAGVVLNKVGEAQRPDATAIVLPGELDQTVPSSVTEPLREALAGQGLGALGFVPYSPLMAAPTMARVRDALGATVIHEGQLQRRVFEVVVGAMTLEHAVPRGLHPGALLVTPGDRDDIVVAAALAELGGRRLAGVLLTGGLQPSDGVAQLCSPALQSGLPVLGVPHDTLETARIVLNMDIDVGSDDRDRAELVVGTVANALDASALTELVQTEREQHLSPPAFRHQLIQRARAANKRIVLPEGTEPRTLAAAAICARRGIARPVLLGNDAEIRRVAKREGVDLSEVEILQPDQLVDTYVPGLVARRQHKGLHPLEARGMLSDNVVLGTMMLAEDHVDGLVSGAVHTTANTIRPALQLIRTKPDTTLVSSIFFMCLPDQVLVYGDCAVNPDPSAAQLADIAIQAADSAAAFGIPPRVAMLSYATGASGAGADVQKVERATELVRQRRPDLLIDGPLQYDAAAVESVGRKKAPHSAVAGRATVFIFPDLDAGNTTYKAVQRSADILSIGPMLQGLAKPVNDLSRGALVEDIVYTIALTAIQATEQR
ncbi:MAG: phosphate acetyltransferase [Myxococcales bacterium]|nr:phosphate acetyltransferase [Myxococcales bacterium]